MSEVYEAVSEDITMTAGGPMGSPVETNWRRYFKSMPEAKRACEDDFGKNIGWRGGTKKCQSPDLGHVQYTITKLKVE